MKMISWNVNGIRAAIKNGFLDTFADIDPDILCIQEARVHKDQVSIDLPEY